MKNTNNKKKEFSNPEGSPKIKGFNLTTIRWILTRIFRSPYKIGVHLPKDHILSRESSILLRDKYIDTPSVTWLGHATFIFKIGDVQIITDPLLFGTPGSSFVRGLKRIPSPLQREDLRGTNILILSHEHFDHMHDPSLKSLPNKYEIKPILPVGVGKKIKKYGFKEATELDWFQSFKVNENISIMAVPATHYSNLSNSTLWAGFVISFKNNIGEEKKIYFGGDTGYGTFFKREIAPYGPFDVACVGVGGFHLKFKSRANIVHTSPEQAIQIAKDINVKKIIGMHWGTMRMADEDPNELLPRMEKYAGEINYSGDIVMLKIGETIAI